MAGNDNFWSDNRRSWQLSRSVENLKMKSNHTQTLSRKLFGHISFWVMAGRQALFDILNLFAHLLDDHLEVNSLNRRIGGDGFG